MTDLWADLVTKLTPATEGVTLGTIPLLIAIAVGAVGALWRPAWVALRLLTTLVHELGHATMAVLVGRKVHGIVVRADSSGLAVTAGKKNGFGRILTTWAGYPAPAITALAAAAAATTGYSGIALFVFTVLSAWGLVMARSVTSVAVFITAVAGFGSLWWFGDDSQRAQGLITVATLLLFGAWRSLRDVSTSRDSGSDTKTLATLTAIPSVFWLGTFFVVNACATTVLAWGVIQHLS